MKASDVILSAGGALVSILLGGNIYFVNRLVDKVDKIEETTWSLKQQVLILKITFENKFRTKTLGD